ncbi:mannosyltransferase [Artomyces pyxidatus]|uniref:Mannosyltransferase n=1 Tax=Artomyces pyxidatus TaxID=48021 RepID=A0ACB8T0J0_9AGAM|nr:mannosyltransferase [Artomyces pyxidatus]
MYDFSSTVALARDLLFNPNSFWRLAFLIILGDAVLTQLIIHFVPYTEIDWETYMSQVELYIKGVRDYSLITGPTGPLVYPAGHVHIHELLYNITNAGSDKYLAQQIYAALYVVSLALSCALYSQAGGQPNWVILLLPLSKRLHSIYVLRLFNDTWAVAAAQIAVFAYARGLDDIGTLLFSAALSIKMSVLLYLPGILVVLLRRRGLSTMTRLVVTMGSVQALIALPFREHPLPYLKNAFDLSRVFLYEWTVNWRFVSEATFLDATFAKSLLLAHAVVLVAFGLFKWCRPDGGVLKVIERALRHPSYPAGRAPTTADEVTTILLTSNLIGILFARSLHYQFYSWYAQQLPFLAWRTPYPTLMKLSILAAIEYAWNIFPSTVYSSAILCTANTLLVVGIWFGYASGRHFVSSAASKTE